MLYFRDREQMLKLLTFSSNRGKLTDVFCHDLDAITLFSIQIFVICYDPLPYGYLDRGKYFCNCRPLYQITVEDFFYYFKFVI